VICRWWRIVVELRLSYRAVWALRTLKLKSKRTSTGMVICVRKYYQIVGNFPTALRCCTGMGSTRIMHNTVPVADLRIAVLSPPLCLHLKRALRTCAGAGCPSFGKRPTACVVVAWWLGQKRGEIALSMHAHTIHPWPLPQPFPRSAIQIPPHDYYRWTMCVAVGD
jgi:hypothetical protein